MNSKRVKALNEFFLLKNIVSLFSLVFFIVSYLSVSDAQALPDKYKIIIEKNPFSPQRQYIPFNQNSPAQDKTLLTKKETNYNILLRGTFYNGHRWMAIIEVPPQVRREFKLEKNRFILEEGQKFGPCTVKQIKRGEVILGGKCAGSHIRLADSPERKKPLRPSFNAPSSNIPHYTKQTKIKSLGPPKKNFKEPPNPFLKNLEQKNVKIKK